MSEQSKYFELNAKQLTELFDIENYRDRHNIQMLKNLGYADGIMEKLKTNQNEGINEENIEEMKLRASLFGTNNLNVEQSYQHCWLEAFEDNTIRFFCITSFLLIIINAWIQGWQNYWQEEGYTLISIFLYVSIIAGNNFIKKKYIVKLKDEVNQKYYYAKRGGKTIELNSNEILVGDILQFQRGEVMPADGILVQSDDIVVDDPILKIDRFGKQSLNQNNENSAFPFIPNGSLFLTGTALVLILAVGSNTYNLRSGNQVENEVLRTPLQDKLINLQEKIGVLGAKAALCTFIIMFLNLIYESIFGSFSFFSAICIKEILNLLTISTTIFFISVPEGLSSLVMFVVSYFFDQMRKEQILFKNLEACEKIGNVNYIIIYISGKIMIQLEEDFLSVDFEDLKQLIKQSIALKVEILVVTQNNLDVGISLGQKIGLLENNYEFNQDSFVVMEGKTFHNMVEGFYLQYINKHLIQILRNYNNFDQISSKIKLLTSSTLEEAQLLVTGFKQQGNIVAYLQLDGEEMIRYADIRVKKESPIQIMNFSDIAILDGKYQSVVGSINWGRNLNHQVHSIVEFYLTVDITVVVITLVWILFLKKSPFNLSQFLWINLIMDSFAIMILGTEKQGDRTFSSNTFPKQESIINNIIWRNIASKVVSQIIFLMSILLFRNFLLQSESDNQVESLSMQKLEAMIFNSLILMQGLNLICINKVIQYANKKQILLKTITAIILPQIIFAFKGELLFHIDSLNILEQILCFLIAFSSLLFSNFLNQIHNQIFQIDKLWSKSPKKLD